MKKCLALLGLVLMPATLAQAGGFHAAELLYIPAAAFNEGAGDSVWRSDLYVTNVDDVPVDVAVFFLPSSLIDNSFYLDDRSFGLGGREEEGWGYVNENLADIAPNATVFLEDIVGEYWAPDFGTDAQIGMMVIFAYEAGTVDEPTYRNVSAHSRIYNSTTIWIENPDYEEDDGDDGDGDDGDGDDGDDDDGEEEPQYIQKDVKYGQTMPGVPWYNMADAGAVSEQGDFSVLYLGGGRQDEAHRYNIGFVNASDKQTGLTLEITPYDSTGEVFTDDDGDPISRTINLGPMCHYQYNEALKNWFTLDQDVSDVTLKVQVVSWTTNNPEPTPMFTCYGSVIDNNSDDPTTILPTFAQPYNVECMWPSPDDGDEDADDGGEAMFSSYGVDGPRRHGSTPPLTLPPRRY